MLGSPSALKRSTPEGSEQDTYVGPNGPESPKKSTKVLFGGRELRRVLLATYASGQIFEETQQKLHESLEVAGISEHWPWNQSMFDEGIHAEWYRQNERVNFRRGGAWKPYIIWQAFRRVEWGDWLAFELHEENIFFFLSRKIVSFASKRQIDVFFFVCVCVSIFGQFCRTIFLLCSRNVVVILHR